MFSRPCAIVLLIAHISSAAISQPAVRADNDPPAFRSDGCSLFLDGCHRDCCEAHDRDYFFGGTAKERRASDKRLYECVRRKKGWQHKLLAPLMWIGVRIGGVPFLPTPFRWGFGKNKKAKKPERPVAVN